MPELPEVQAHAERLTAQFAGVTLSGFRPISFTALKTFAPDPAIAVGAPLQSVGHRGKHLLLRFAPATFVVHLMQGGRLKPDAKQSAKPRGGVARWTFADDSALLLSEPGSERRAGVWVHDTDPLLLPPLEGLGPDADTLDAAAWGELVAGHSKRLHGLLRDQRIVAGIGRRLSNEICHRAKLSPFANASKLSTDEVSSLAASVRECIDEALVAEREQPEMVKSIDRGGIHHHAGEPCAVCGDVLRTVEYRAYTVVYCPTCQTNGKVLADNTTSKFLK